MDCHVHQSLLHRHLVLGVDREIGMLSILLLVSLGYGMQSWIFFSLLTISEAVLFLILRHITKRDTWAVPVALKMRKLSKYFPARSRLEGLAWQHAP